MIKNKYKVPQKMWNKFKEAGQQVFNDVMDQAVKNQSCTSHPDSDIPHKEWETICWNMSCYAAWSVSKQKLVKGTTVINIKKGKEVSRQKVA